MSGDASSEKTILIFVHDDYEDLEVWYPKLRLEEAGYTVKLAGLGEKSYRGKHGYPLVTDGSVGDYDAGKLAGVLAPGGWAPDKLREWLQRRRATGAVVDIAGDTGKVAKLEA